MIRVLLPQHLQIQAQAPREVKLDVAAPVTARSILEALENNYPALRGTIRDPLTHKRRPLVRFFACEEDVSADPDDAALPTKVATGEEPFIIIGAIAGG
jgi:hypothetical protein